MIEDYIEHEGLDKYYVADKKVYGNGKKISLFNMRTLESFLAEQDPKKLKYLKTGEIEVEFAENVEDIDFSGLLKNSENYGKLKSYITIEELIRESGKDITISELSEKAGKSVITVRRVVSKLIEDGKVERVGGNRKGSIRWIGDKKR